MTDTASTASTLSGCQMFDRRGFLRFLGMGAAVAVAPTKTYAFFGGILRPRTDIQYPMNGTTDYHGVWKWQFSISQFEKLNPHLTQDRFRECLAYMKDHNERVIAEATTDQIGLTLFT